MQIITIDDRDFDELYQALKSGKAIGRFQSKGRTQIVCATRNFVLVTTEDNPQKIALKPARGLAEAEELALELLLREEARGNSVSISQ